jgi:hypothetical protein
MNILCSSLLRPALALLCLSPACALATTVSNHGIGLAGSPTTLGLGAGCNGPVNALVEAPDGGIFVGGDFSLCGEVGVNNIARFEPSTRTWSALGNSQFNGVSGQVQTLALHDGALFVGGSFTRVMPGSSTELLTSLARWDGASWSRLSGDSEVDFEQVSSLLSSPQGLYLGGRFSVAPAQGEPFGNIALWTGARFEPIAPGANAAANEVQAIALYNGELHISGFLNGLSIQGHRPTGARRLARWSQGSWRVVGSEGGGALEGGISLLALRLTVHEGALYLGGEFSTVDAGAAAPVAANNIARWDGSAWTALSTGVNGRVIALHSSPQGLHVGGRFGSGAVSQPKLARWTAAGWVSVSPQALAGQASEVRALAESSQGLLVGGRFGWASGGTGPRVLNHVASIQDAEWAPLGEIGGSGANGPIYALHEHAGDLYAGGEFTTIAGVAASHVARHDGTGWRSLGAEGSGTNGPVYALESSDSDLFIGGGFSAIQQGATSAAASRLARWNGSSLTALGPNVGMDGVVRALLADGSTLIVGGAFSTVGAGGVATPANSIARFDGSTWSVFGSSNFNGVQGEVYALTRWNGELFVGGRFRFALNASGSKALEARSIARWDGSSWSSLGSNGGSGLSYGPPTLGLTPEVHVMQAGADGLYVGGLFHEANAGAAATVPVWSIARWTGSDWQALGGPGQGPIGYVYALHLQGNRLQVGGLFSRVRATDNQDIPSSSIAVFDEDGWTPSATGVGRGQNFEFVAALHGDGESTYAAGRFGVADGQPASHLVRIDLPMFASGFEAEEAVPR